MTTTMTKTAVSTATMNPYKQTGSVAFKTFELAKQGTTRAALVSMFTKADVGPARLLRELKLQDFRNITWTYTESEDGSLKVTNVKAKSAKAATKAAPVETKKAQQKPAAKVAKVEVKAEEKPKVAKVVKAAPVETPKAAEVKPKAVAKKAVATKKA